MAVGFDVFNYGHSYNLHGEVNIEDGDCYYCIEGSFPNYVVWINGDNDPNTFNSMINKTQMWMPQDFYKMIVKKSLDDNGCTMDCVKAKEAPSSSNGGGSNGGGSNGGGSNGGGSNGGEEDFMFGMSKMTVGLVGAGALVGIYLLIS